MTTREAARAVGFWEKLLPDVVCRIGGGTRNEASYAVQRAMGPGQGRPARAWHAAIDYVYEPNARQRVDRTIPGIVSRATRGIHER